MFADVVVEPLGLAGRQVHPVDAALDRRPRAASQAAAANR